MAHDSTPISYAQAPPPGGSGLRALIEDARAVIDDLEALRAALLDADPINDEALDYCRGALARACRFRAHIHEWGRV